MWIEGCMDGGIADRSWTERRGMEGWREEEGTKREGETEG